MSFSSLGLHEHLVNLLKTLGYDTPTPIQQAAIPEILTNQDVLAQAQTGTGKTAAFTLPIIHRFLEDNDECTKPASQTKSTLDIRTLILAPTRELAQQVHKSVVKYSSDIPFKTVVVYGGASLDAQLDSLQQGCDLLVATPGRLLEFAIKQWIDLSSVDTLILDEADRMLDMGFIADIKHILKFLPTTRQTLLFSATFNDDVFALSKSLLKKPKLIQTAKDNSAVSTIDQRFYEVDKKRKAGLLVRLINAHNWHQVLIFSRTKQGVDELTNILSKEGVHAVAIHGDKSQNARESSLDAFKQDKAQVLVATDVAARGLDIQKLPVVINFELPYNPEDYVHRIGRTARAGQKGTAISLIAHQEKHLFEDIKKLIGEELMIQWHPGFEPDLLAQEESSRHKRKPSKKTLRAKALGNTNGNKGNSKKRRKP